MELDTLLLVEVASKAWFRFILTGNIIGGRLKTPGQADRESLQAKWIKNISEVLFLIFFFVLFGTTIQVL
jgi:8-oxo-dGDP phosphatase